MGLNIATERDRQTNQTRDIYEGVLRLADRLQLLGRELRFSDTFSIRGEGDRTSVQQLAAQFRLLPQSQQHTFPALLNGLGMLQAATGEFDLHGDALDTAWRDRRDGSRHDQARRYIETM